MSWEKRNIDWRPSGKLIVTLDVRPTTQMSYLMSIMHAFFFFLNDSPILTNTHSVFF